MHLPGTALPAHFPAAGYRQLPRTSEGFEYPDPITIKCPQEQKKTKILIDQSLKTCINDRGASFHESNIDEHNLGFAGGPHGRTP